MQTEFFEIDGPVHILPKKFGDNRGYFSETFRQDWFEKNVAQVNFLQENQSFSSCKGTIRGLHLQCGEFAQGKLVQCVAGEIFDVAVDVRPNSKSFGKYISVNISAEIGNQLWIPEGFLHGFCTLSDNCKIQYKVTNYYSPKHEQGVKYDDDAIAINWPVLNSAPRLSPRDLALGALKDLEAL